jgi:hypothetical protein
MLSRGMMEVGPIPENGARRSELGHGNMQLLKSCQTVEVEGCPAINQGVVQPDIGNGGEDD